MSSTHVDIGRRVKESLESRLTQTALAEKVGMKVDAMSRAISGQRGFSSVELVDIAAVLDRDVHWLITGEADPMRVQVAARHHFSHETGRHTNAGRSTDQQDLDAVVLAYRQAYPEQIVPAELPPTPQAIREALGPSFARDFADRIETALGVDVIRLPRLSTAYSLTVGGRRVVVLPTEGKWFRSNFSLAHELAHLALGHHDTGFEDAANEKPANAFAANLLLPEDIMRSIDWGSLSATEAARFIWDAGVGTEYLRNRIDTLSLHPSADAWTVISRPMPGALRRYTADLGESLVRETGPFVVPANPIDKRMTAASARRFPLSLVAAHREGVEDGRLAPATLAWILECSVDSLFDEVETAGTLPVKDDFSDFSL